jgi:hypothetical protein
VAACVCAPLHIGRCWEEEKEKKGSGRILFYRREKSGICKDYAKELNFLSTDLQEKANLFTFPFF